MPQPVEIILAPYHAGAARVSFNPDLEGGDRIAAAVERLLV